VHTLKKELQVKTPVNSINTTDTGKRETKYKDWIRQEYEAICKSLDYRFVPGREIENRLAKLKRLMAKKGIQAVLVFHKLTSYYLSGTGQNSILHIPLEGKPLLMVKRELERAKIESPLDDVIGMRSLRDLPSLIQEHSGSLPETIGLEMDVLPVNDYFKIKELFPNARFLDAFPVMMDVRKIKSSFEINLMRKAGEIGEKVYEEGRRILKKGMTDLEFGGLLELVAKRHGHEGFLRTRTLNFEAYTWHILSGPPGGLVSLTESPMGRIGAFSCLSHRRQPQSPEGP
jgi:Xaa-Pro aminopeptidase